MNSASFVVLCFCASLPTLCSANAFLSRIDTLTGSMEGVNEADIRASLLEEIETALGSNVAETRIGKLEAVLRPIFLALPKNPRGYLDHATVRYALHRLFVQLHGWHIKGLSPGGDKSNSSSPTNVLKDRVPSYIQDLFEERLGDRGMGLVELAVLASTLEQLIHSEVVGRLEAGYKRIGMPTLGFKSTKQVDAALSAYMMSFILGKNLTSMTEKEFLNLHSKIRSVYAFWDETNEFVKNVMQDVLQSNAAPNNTQEHEIDFATATRIAEEVGEKYGTFQDTECKQLKANLLNLNDRNTGRILLADFYRQAVDGTNWQFSESPDYLRQIGALDESDPSALRVIIPNYVGASSNCIASSSFYSVCCFDECEGLLGHLERQIAAPESSPSRIIELVSAMNSSTVHAPRELSADLLRRLIQVGDSHGGAVPLHGRLFSQWMHHAFPRECPFPHISGTTNSQTPEEWQAGGLSAAASVEEMERHIEETEVFRNSAVSAQWEQNLTSPEAMLWMAEEELLVRRVTSPSPTGTRWQTGLLFGISLYITIRFVKSSLTCSRLDKRFLVSEKVFV